MAFCTQGLPHAIVFDSGLRCEEFDRLQCDMSSEVSEFAFIEIVEGALLEISESTGSGVARVGKETIDSGLPSALMFELTRSL